jgi:hypothetical protein
MHLFILFLFFRSHIITITIYIYYKDNFFILFHHFLTIEKKLKLNKRGKNTYLDTRSAFPLS